MFSLTAINSIKDPSQKRSIKDELTFATDDQKKRDAPTSIYDDGRIRSLQDIRLFVFLAVSFVLIGGVFMVSDYFNHKQEHTSPLFSVSTDVITDSNNN